MDFFSQKYIKSLLKKHQIYPSKRFGQNFLVDKTVFGKIIGAANLSPEDTVLEIGPGIGNLTQELAKKAKRVVAVEKDGKMVEVLKETLKDFKNVEIIQGDILKLPTTNYSLPTNYKVVANLPYYITSPVIRNFLELPEVRPREIVLMVQREVAERICSKPPKMNLLAVSVQFYGEPKIISSVSKNSFWPKPKVDSAILKIIVNRKQLTVNRDLFFKIVKAGFSQPRKQLVNNFARKLALSPPNGLKLDKDKIKSWLLKNKINYIRRAETLNIQNWVNLVKSFSEF